MLHQDIDQRSLEMDRLIAEKIRANPALLRRALDNIDDYVNRSTSSDSGRDAYLEWKTIIQTHSLEEVLSILTEDSEEGQRLRQSTPFMGIISQEERTAIFAKYEPLRARAYH